VALLSVMRVLGLRFLGHVMPPLTG
jgi:hypothetical protein